MANKNLKEDGVWRTINGRRVFIKEGQTASEAIKEYEQSKSKTETKQSKSFNKIAKELEERGFSKEEIERAKEYYDDKENPIKGIKELTEQLNSDDRFEKELRTNIEDFINKNSLTDDDDYDTVSEKMEKLAERMDEMTDNGEDEDPSFELLAEKYDELMEKRDQFESGLLDEDNYDSINEEMEQLAAKMDKMTDEGTDEGPEFEKLANRYDELMEKRDQIESELIDDDGGVLKDTALQAYEDGDISYEELRDDYFDGDGEDVGKALDEFGSERAKKELTGPEQGLKDDNELNYIDKNGYEPLAVKDVMDSDGFTTEYSMYKTPDGKYKMVFGDREIYGPDSDADMEFDTIEEATEWFDNYKGFEDYEYADDIMYQKDDGSFENAYDAMNDMNQQQAKQFVEDLHEDGALREEDYQKLKKYVGYDNENNDARYEELKSKLQKGEIEPYSDEDYELMNLNYDKKVKQGIMDPEEVEYQKAKLAWQRDEISREEFDKISDRLNKEYFSKKGNNIDKEFPSNFSEEVESTAHRINTGGYDDIDDVVDDFAKDQGISREEARYALLKDEFKTRQDLYEQARQDGSYSQQQLEDMEAMSRDSYSKLQEAQQEYNANYWDDDKYKEVYNKMSKEDKQKIDALDESIKNDPSSRNVNARQKEAQEIYERNAFKKSIDAVKREQAVNNVKKGLPNIDDKTARDYVSKLENQASKDHDDILKEVNRLNNYDNIERVTNKDLDRALYEEEEMLKRYNDENAKDTLNYKTRDEQMRDAGIQFASDANGNLQNKANDVMNKAIREKASKQSSNKIVLGQSKEDNKIMNEAKKLQTKILNNENATEKDFIKYRELAKKYDIPNTQKNWDDGAVASLERMSVEDFKEFKGSDYMKNEYMNDKIRKGSKKKK